MCHGWYVWESCPVPFNANLGCGYHAAICWVRKCHFKHFKEQREAYLLGNMSPTTSCETFLLLQIGYILYNFYWSASGWLKVCL